MQQKCLFVQNGMCIIDGWTIKLEISSSMYEIYPLVTIVFIANVGLISAMKADWPKRQVDFFLRGY